MQPPKKSPLMEASGTIIWLTSLVTTFVLWPRFFYLTDDWILGIARMYSRDPEFFAIASFGWMVVSAFLLFNVTRAVLSALVAAGGLATIMRFLRDKD